MTIEIKVPTLGESVTTATIGKWLKQPGDSVAADEPVVELETDKVSVEVAAPAAGRLGAHAVAEGEEVAVGALLTSVEEGAAGAAPKAAAPAAAKPAPKAEAKPAAAPAPAATPAAAPPAETDYDVIVIGAGPGGYVCAIRAAQLGFKVACVEKRATLGGTCLNVGCIPSKALLQSSENYHAAAHDYAGHGIVLDSVKLDLARMMARKGEVVEANVKGVEFLFKKNKVTWLKGTGKLEGTGRITVDGKPVTAKHIVIASGSDSAGLPGVEVDEKVIVTSTGALELSAVPKKMVVIGGGVIGLELGSVWHRLGAEVTVVEFLDRLVPGTDGEIAKQFQRILTKQGLQFKLGHKVTKADKTGKGVTLTVEPAAGGTAETLEADIVLLAIGRNAYSKGLGVEEAGVALDKRGRIITDGHFATSVPGVYAIGDVIAGPMLAHKAEEEGVAIAEILAGQAGHVNYDAIPGVVYTWPEVATVGRTEEDLKSSGVTYKVGKFPFTANGRARAIGMTDGFVKVLAEATTDRVLGVHIIGPGAGEMIAEATLAMEFGASSEDIARTCHAHPTLSEALKEAALDVEKRAIHI
ncbi:dihydrolipoamide dehydrogenase [Gluconacetobacter diazotrophicus PA1 5]|uniref:Dihydrolipoyl dehydrogenase n=1 Tax=Gluconacetobacter diazotrophicus (strain ATCC 49037 / DSM 5601 / CCUG 37298 / CIP 103539 / LMG 7603 / PAl5) TaxID=272568 RepID=A9HFH1_GLUDA|nr:dihydrolipoyl dehydrogenase [Gluconacetobacter diazotrophicus]ACI51879.1 dihydrolipoamide dehydrogenase [Gluconacetobacter diazotrophicus PA1 5]TWB11224.1 dihydrolipoamide dehydrogenase [Gluconacetobacter diazotrophicus]CAP55361.1 2-oxoglutarate dehydrogenase E3 component [Gluconacetobacter diazotrophicus PA1 5]